MRISAAFFRNTKNRDMEEAELMAESMPDFPLQRLDEKNLIQKE